MVKNLALVSLYAVFSVAWASTGPSEAAKKANDLWEKMLAQKGLTSTQPQSFALSLKAVSGSAFANDNAGREQRTIVSCLPDKWWVFDDYRPGKLGASARAYDLRSGQGWLTYLGGAQQAQKMDVHLRGLQDDRSRILAILFGQAPGFTPVPIETTHVRKGSNEFEAVTVEWQDEKFIYYLDPGTYLPRKLEVIRTGASTIGASQGRPAKTLPFTSTTPIEMSDYQNVGGLQIPSKIKIRDSSYEVEVQLNVQVADNLFDQPPSPSTDASSWQSK